MHYFCNCSNISPDAAYRMTTLSRVDLEGIPFFLQEVDQAGNKVRRLGLRGYPKNLHWGGGGAGGGFFSKRARPQGTTGTGTGTGIPALQFQFL